MTDEELTVEQTIDDFIAELDRLYGAYRRKLIRLGVNANDASELLFREMRNSLGLG